MIIESMELKNFRNYRELQLHFDAKTNIFYGDNAQGKDEYTGSRVFKRNH